jgi:hypothetical protein
MNLAPNKLHPEWAQSNCKQCCCWLVTVSPVYKAQPDNNLSQDGVLLQSLPIAETLDNSLSTDWYWEEQKN